jgi:uncharacterized small protein (DUF1192 family)
VKNSKKLPEQKVEKKKVNRNIENEKLDVNRVKEIIERRW